MFTFGILLLITVVHMSISIVFFPNVWKFWSETSSRLFGKMGWKIMVVLNAMIGNAMLAFLILWTTQWCWLVLGILEIFSLIKAYKMNKMLKV